MRGMRRRPSMILASVVAVGCGLSLLKEATYLNDVVMSAARQGATLSASDPSTASSSSSSSSSAAAAAAAAAGASSPLSASQMIERGALQSWLDRLVRGGKAPRNVSAPADAAAPEAAAASASHRNQTHDEWGQPVVLPSPQKPMPAPTSGSRLSPAATKNPPAKIPPMREFYSVARTDRSGSSIHDMVLALAHGFATNATYKGACYQKPMKVDASKRQADKEGLIRAMGLQDVLVFACPAQGRTRQRLIVPRNAYYGKRYSLLTPDFLEWLRSRARAVPPRAPPPGGSAVVHVRRGDIDPCREWKDRYLPNSYYLDVLKRHVPPGVPVTLFSESAAFENFTDFENAGISVKLDTDVADVWEAILAASHVVLSRSTFAYVPALLNGNNATIVYPPQFAVATPKGWKRADADTVARSDRRVKELAALRCRTYRAVKPGRSSYNASRR